MANPSSMLPPTAGPPAATPAARTPGKAMAAAASKSYNVASVWEQLAALTEDQLRAVDLVAHSCSQRPFPPHLQDDSKYDAQAAGSDSHGKDSYVGTLEDAVLHNTNQFHKWHSEVEAACASETEEKYKRYADLLNSHVRSSEGILGKVDQTLELFDSLLTQHREVSVQNKALYSSCEQLVREKEQLVEFADAIRAKLRFFDEFETVSAQFTAAQSSLDNEQFLTLLRKLDDCMAYVAQNPQYADSGAYVAKFRTLQGRALSTVRGKVQQVLRHATTQVQAAIAEAASGTSVSPAAAAANGGTAAAATAAAAAAAADPSLPSSSGSSHGGAPAGAPPTPSGGSALKRTSSFTMAGLAGASGGPMGLMAEGAEMSLLYVRFRAAAESGLKGLFKEIESRAQRQEYAKLLGECQQLYAQARLTLVQPFVAQRLEQQHRGQALNAFTRHGCEHLMHVCALESQLFEQFFPGSRDRPEALAPLTEPLCTVMYDALRPVIIQLSELDDICELIDILKHEVLGEQVAKRGAGGEALKPMVSRTLSDVQARLIYRCQAYIKEEVSGFQPSANDVDYPARLERAAAAAAADHAAAAQRWADDPEGASGAAESSGNGHAAAKGDPYEVLYPPLRSTLVCLSKLYRAVDARIFGGLAQEAVAACTNSVQLASRQIQRKASALDAQLFLVRHLLFLREQIAPFDVDFSTTDVDLDFTHMRDHMRRIMAGETSLFTLSSNNAMYRMLGAGGPGVVRHQVDSKKELEKQLKAVCEAFIMAVTKVAVEPLLSFITKVTAVKVAAAANPAAARPLREQAFASPAKLGEIVGKVNEALEVALPKAMAKMQLYLSNPSTHAILFKPVKSNIAEAHGQVATLLQHEYAAEEVALVPLKAPHELAALLDALC